MNKFNDLNTKLVGIVKGGSPLLKVFEANVMTVLVLLVLVSTLRKYAWSFLG